MKSPLVIVLVAVVYPARAARCCRRHHPVECAGAACGPQNRPCALRRQHSRTKGSRGCAARCPAAGRSLPLANNPLVSKLSFTGSTEVGKPIMRAASDRVVPVSLELGGKTPSLVFPDANEDWVVDGIISAMRFTRQTQSCTAGSRLFPHPAISSNF